jgi:hypothetical protein
MKEPPTLEIKYEDRQLLVLSLALCSLLRPGWEYACREMAKRMCGGSSEMFDGFRECNEARTPPHPDLVPIPKGWPPAPEDVSHL